MLFLDHEIWLWAIIGTAFVNNLKAYPDLSLIPIFQYKSRTIPISRLHVWKSRVFVLFKLDKRKGVSLCRMARVFKPTKCGLKINFIIGWIDGLSWILCTLWLSEWSRLAPLSCRPELTCYSSAVSRNSAAYEGSSHLSSILSIFLHL